MDWKTTFSYEFATKKDKQISGINLDVAVRQSLHSMVGGWLKGPY
jgi:hypothetical protein